MDDASDKCCEKITGTIVLAGGGTGGHLFPGISVAQAFQKKCPKIRIEFYGTATGLDSKLVGDYGFPLKVIGIERRRPGLLGLCSLAINLLKSRRECIREMKKNRPLAVIGLGGFAASTPGLAAHKLGIPLFLMEQNAIPGRTNRYLSGYAKCIFTQFESSVKHFGNKCRVEVLGNPVREEVLREDVAIPAEWGLERNVPTVVVVGGSQGARNLNKIACEALSGLKGAQVLHIAGDRDEDDVRKWYSEWNYDARIIGFCRNMGAAYKAADILISRAGATAIAEITALGKPAILVPFPFAKDDHQTANARELETNGAAVLFAEKNLTAGKLLAEVDKMLNNEPLRKTMGGNARKMGSPDAAGSIVDAVIRYL